MRPVGKRITNGYSMRFPEDLRARLERISLERSAIAGKRIPISDVLIEALEYGLLRPRKTL